MMLTDSQIKQLGARRYGGSSTTLVDGLPSAGCGWLGSSLGSADLDRPVISYNVQVIPLPTENSAGVPRSTVTQINGFGAISNLPVDAHGGETICQIAIDVAPQRSVRVQALLRPYGPQLPENEVCRDAADAASKIMTTIVAIASR